MRVRRIEMKSVPGHKATIRKADLSACDAQAGGLICADLARTDTTRTCGDMAECEVILQHFVD